MIRKRYFSLLFILLLLVFSSLLQGQEVVWSDYSTGQIDLSHRQGHGMAYDSSRNKIVLFGGKSFDNDPTWHDDTWEWDCATKKWSRIYTHNTPRGRAYHAMVYNPVRKSVMLQGGRQESYGIDEDKYSPSTWEYKNGNWQLLSTSGPGKREKHKMVWDEARKQIVLFGGIEYPTVYGDTWVWENSGWTLKNPGTKPRERFGHSMSYDTKRQRVVMHSGAHDYDEHTVSGSTFEWDGNNWKMVATGGPGYKVYADMVYDVNRGVSVLFGGSYISDAARDALAYYNETWEWNGIAWTKRTFSGFQPEKRYKHAMVYDSKNKQVLLWDGWVQGGFDHYMLYLGEKEDETIADLSILKATTNPRYETAAGEKVKFTTTIKNIGSKQAGKFRIRYYLSLDAELDDLDILVFQKLIHTKLNPGKRMKYSRNKKIKTSVAEDQYYVIAEIVPLENDEVSSNNVEILAGRLTVQAVDVN